MVSKDADLTGLHADLYQLKRDPFRWADTPQVRAEGNDVKEWCSITYVPGHPEGVLVLPTCNGYSWITLPHGDDECDAHRPPKLGGESLTLGPDLVERIKDHRFSDEWVGIAVRARLPVRDV